MQKFKTLKEIGNGSFGVVTLAEHDGKMYAVKQMKRMYTTWDECLQLRELRSLKKLSHPNIIKLREVVRQDNILYFVFDYCDGGSLLDVMAKLTTAQVIQIQQQVFQALDYLHVKMGLMHRDIKPDNVLVTSEFIPKLADFGLCRPISDSEDPLTSYISTIWYRAPELLIEGDKAYSELIDIWAAGCMLYELLTKKPLFPGTSDVDMLSLISKCIGSHPSVSMVKFAKGTGFDHSAQINDVLLATVCYEDSRQTAQQVLQLPLFNQIMAKYVSSSSMAKSSSFSDSIKKASIASSQRKLSFREESTPLSQALQPVLSFGDQKTPQFLQLIRNPKKISTVYNRDQDSLTRLIQTPQVFKFAESKFTPFQRTESAKNFRPC